MSGNNPVSMRAGVDELLTQLRAASKMAGGIPGAAAGSAAPGDFGLALKSALDRVNDTQVQATKMAQDFELGRSGATLSDTMIAMQKANISLQQAVQVRNRLISAYHEIMNMQV